MTHITKKPVAINPVSTKDVTHDSINTLKKFQLPFATFRLPNKHAARVNLCTFTQAGYGDYKRMSAILN